MLGDSGQGKELDLERASAARINDAFLGGSYNFGVDRRFVERAERGLPGIAESYRASRAFLRRSVDYLIAHGLRQFVVVGSGLPSSGHVHEIARRRATDFRVLYVDNDPLTVMQGARQLVTEPRAEMFRADFREPWTILDTVRDQSVLDIDQPMVLMLPALHLVPESDDPQSLVAVYRDALTPGSYLCVAHVVDSECPEHAATLTALYTESADPLFARDTAWVDLLFGDFELVTPGAGQLSQWRPDPSWNPQPPRYPLFYGGLARKPGHTPDHTPGQTAHS